MSALVSYSIPSLCTPDDSPNERGVAGAVDEGVLHLCVAGVLDVVWGRDDEGAEAQIECDAPLLQEQK